ncbi:MAG: T9SS type A sorting domain-containing protein, partial [Saprospiraceae bacterium]
NNGTSWQDAFNDLSEAIDSSNVNDEIWVAAGTYIPANPSLWSDTIKRTFYLHQDISLYGGFNGTETTLDQRDPVANVTILSGDVNGDDVVDDFDSNKDDNVINVIYVEATVSTASTIDGFTIQGGHADVDDGGWTNKRGGGIFSYGAVQISNCYFTQNYTIWHAGGLYYFEAGAEGGKIEDCIFEKNKCLKSGGGMTVAEISGQGVTVENCQFLSNEAENGGGFYNFKATVTLEECQFFENNSTFIGGGMITSYSENGDSLNTTINNCSFDGNRSANGGGLYFLSDSGNDNEIIIQSTNFTNNEASQTALDNFAEAGAIAIDLQGGLQNCNIQIIDCLIENNSAESEVGGIGMYNFSGYNNHLEVTNCQIFNNTTNGTIGGMSIYEVGNSATSAKISNTHFKGNSGSVVPGFILNHFINYNTPTSRNVELINCLFSEHHTNNVTSAVVGNAESELTLTNCTIANNEMPSIGNYLSGKTTLQNTILQSNGYPNLAQGGSFVPGDIVSLGGNLISDDALNASTNNADQISADPLFETGTFQLSQNSPAIDAGTLLDDISEFDLAGDARLQGGCLDIGAYESSYDAGLDCVTITNVKELLLDADLLEIFPNPVTDQFQITIENEWRGELTVQIVNSLGQPIRTISYEKFETKNTYDLDIKNLPNGIYRLLVSDGTEMVVESFVKL